MATSEIHWDSKETFCLALPTLREISHEGSPPIRVLCHLNLLFTFLYYFWNKLSTFCEGYVLGTFLWWHLLLFLVWVGLHCSSSLLHRAALQLQCAGFSQHRLSLPSSGSGLWVQQAVAHSLSCSFACGIFPDQGSNPCFLHWQANSLPPSQQ